jgi:hypothetical protein
VALMLVQRFIAVMDHLAGVAHCYGLDIPIGIPVYQTCVICNRAASAHLRNKPF